MAYKWFEHISESVRGKHDYQLNKELQEALAAAGIVPFSVSFERKRGRARVYFTAENIAQLWSRYTEPAEAFEIVKKIFLQMHPAWKFRSAIENPQLKSIPLEFSDTTI